MAQSKWKRQSWNMLRPERTRPSLPPSPHRRRLDIPGRPKPAEIVVEMTGDMEDD